jgi:DNA-directed RNA polymerase subunit H
MASQNTSKLISQIYNSRRIILDQIQKQGFNVDEYLSFSINEINTMKNNNQLDMLIKKKNKTGYIEQHEKSIYVKYYLAKGLRPNNLEEIIDDLFNIEETLDKKTDILYIIVKDEVNETLANELMHIWERDKIFVVVYPLQRLQFNILDHVLVPSHKVLSEAEKIAICKKYNIMSDEEFPEVQRFDPVAMAIGIRPGQVCEILRPSKTAITAPYYRICVQK